jgi:hypothetical protein
MPSVKISALPPAGAITGAEEFPLVQGGVTSRALVSTLARFTSSGPRVLANDATYTLTHEPIVNGRAQFSAEIGADTTGLTRLQADFDVGDAPGFTFDPGLIEFVGGVVRLKDGGTPTFSLIIPHVNSNTSASGTITCDGFGAPLYTMVDGNDATVCTSNIGAGNEIRYEFSVAQACERYSFVCGGTPANMINGWTIYGSNTAFGQNETNLGTVANQTAWGAGEKREYTIATPGTYKYYRINISGWNGGGQVDVAELRMESPDIVIYPTNTWATVQTKNVSQFPFTSASQTITVNSVTFGKTIPANTSIAILVSFDGRVTWNKWSGAAWVAVEGADLADPTTWNTIAEMEGAFPYTVNQGVDVGLDWMAAFKTTSATASPSVTDISVNYDEEMTFDVCQVGKTGAAGVDIEVAKLTPQTTQFKNKTGLQGTFLLNALIG